MDENGNYYGVMQHSYAVLRNFPKSIDYWKSSTCADSDRYFHVVSVDLSESQLQEFESVTNEYTKLQNETIEFGEQYPDSRSNEWKTKKAYNEAVKDYMARHDAWIAENRDKIHEIYERKSNLWKERVRLFQSFEANAI